jgi:hypothetical protein
MVLGELGSMRNEIAELHQFISSMDELYSEKFRQLHSLLASKEEE